MHDSWTCLMVDKGPGMLTDGTRTALKMAACTLHRKGRDKMLFQGPDCEGVLETEWKSHRVGAIYGVLFRSQLSSEEGEFKVNFLLSQGDLERGALRLGDDEEIPDGEWQSHPHRFPVEALYEFRDLRANGRPS